MHGTTAPHHPLTGHCWALPVHWIKQCKRQPEDKDVRGGILITLKRWYEEAMRKRRWGQGTETGIVRQGPGRTVGSPGQCAPEACAVNNDWINLKRAMGGFAAYLPS